MFEDFYEAEDDYGFFTTWYHIDFMEQSFMVDWDRGILLVTETKDGDYYWVEESKIF